ncbi:hypothetical protein L484_008627 [Morus notabilis]|uniref:High chlorophyll fluorescence 153 n=2 Tax=Morus notabilis TaxID=981085 RepID=W9S4Q2_9ROSA|nr:hypothetical protein L484_008627 [Morus notabilis]
MPTSLSLSLSPSTHHDYRRPTTAAFKCHRFPASPAIRFPLKSRDRAQRGLSVVTRAGPGTSSYVLAFVLPFSLVVITVLTSIRIADKLDRDFLEEVALNEAIREADEEEEEGDYEFPLEQPTTPRTRNRPKREV